MCAHFVNGVNPLPLITVNGGSIVNTIILKFFIKEHELKAIACFMDKLIQNKT